MKNTKWEIGGWRIKNPHTVIKLGFVFDEYKLDQLETLWKAAEQEAATRLGKFTPSDLFHQENHSYQDKIMISYRWYTPKENREPITAGMDLT